MRETRYMDICFVYFLQSFLRIINHFGTPEIDLFATRVNRKCEKFVSWKKDPESIAVDAFTIQWKGNFFYAFPPFSTIPRVLQKIKSECATGIVVVPDLPSQPWYPVFRELIVSKTITLRADNDILFPVNRDRSQFWDGLTLVAGILSGKALN